MPMPTITGITRAPTLATRHGVFVAYVVLRRLNAILKRIARHVGGVSMNKAITLYALVHSVRTILIDENGQVVAYSPISNPSEFDLQALAHQTYPAIAAADFVVTWVKERECYKIFYLPY